MATIERLTLVNPVSDASRWDATAAAVIAWANEHGAALRDAVVLVPFVQLLPLARRAFARAGGWQPRIETTRTLAASLGPAATVPAGQISFDPVLDELHAAALLRSQTWGLAWFRRDARGFEQAARQMMATAHALAQAAFELPPKARDAHWAMARELLGPVTGPGFSERLLARVALEWAAVAPAPATDRLFSMPAPAAWIVVQGGGADPLTRHLLAETDAPALLLDTDADEEDPFAEVAATCHPDLAICEDFEHEAQCAAAQVLAHAAAGRIPVALIAQDRALVRRVRALLARQQVAILDETGWTLSTTRAAGRVMSLLLATRADASTDALLDWLKTGTSWSAADGDGALVALESACRRQQIARTSALAHARLDAAPARLWARAAAVLAPISTAKRQALGSWLALLAEALVACGGMAALLGDSAGRQVLTALRLVNGAGSASDVPMSFDAFRDWIDSALERATFNPPAPVDEAVQVVITPLARAMLRPFAAVVLPGADDRHLGAAPAPDVLLGDSVAGQLGIATLEQRRWTELLAFVQLLASPRVTLMRRRMDGGDPMSDSILVQRLTLATADRGTTLVEWRDDRPDLSVSPTPIGMTAPSAADLLPERLSASACEALRACPYRFFALNMLRLREEDELEREIEKRDYGTWLHAVLFDFHDARDAPQSREAEIAQLMQIAEKRRELDRIVDTDFLPFAASFASFAPRYIDWLHERDAEGARWQAGEVALSISPEGLGGNEMHGRIDRIDEVRIGHRAAIQLIDYKTGSVTGLKAKVKEPLEDTQLAFYAALMRGQTQAPLDAMYLALDGTRQIDKVPHHDVAESATALVEGLSHDLARLRAGAGLPALGEGVTCDYCEARGICRRDHWTST